MEKLPIVSLDSDGEAFVTSLTLSQQEGLPHHKNILELIRKHLPYFESFGLVAFETRARFEGQHGGGDVQIAHLNEHQASFLMCLMANTEVVLEFKRRLIEEFYRLAKRQATKPLEADTPATLALRDFEAGMKLAVLLGCPPAYATAVSAQHAERLTGFPVTMLANESAVCQDVPLADVMLEPTELGKRVDLSGAELNKKLEACGLQRKLKGGGWIPTELGAPLCQMHQWATASKSGTNLKWRSEAVLELVQMS